MNTNHNANANRAATRVLTAAATRAPSVLRQAPRRRTRAKSRFGALSAAVTAAVVGLGLAMLTGSAASALWADGVALTNATVIAGDLRLELDGPPTLDVPGQVTAPVLLMPGDNVYITQQVTTRTVGDNLDAELTVTLHPARGFGITGHFTLTDQNGGEATTQTPLGQAATLPATSGGTATWLVKIVAVMDFDPWTADLDKTTRHQVALGELEIGLRQTRTGFDPADLSHPARTDRGEVAR